MNKIRRNLQQSSLINKIIDKLINNYLCYVKLYLHMLQLNSYITVKVNDIRAWQSSWNPVKPRQRVLRKWSKQEGEWRARAWRRRVKQVEIEPRGTVHRWYYCFVYEVFAPCTRVTTIRYQAPLVSFNPRGEKVPLLSFPSTNFRLFFSLFSSLLPLLPGEPTYFNKVDLFPRMRLFRSFRALHGSKRFSQSPRCILELVILCV